MGTAELSDEQFELLDRAWRAGSIDAIEGTHRLVEMDLLSPEHSDTGRRVRISEKGMVRHQSEVRKRG